MGHWEKFVEYMVGDHTIDKSIPYKLIRVFETGDWILEQAGEKKIILKHEEAMKNLDYRALFQYEQSLMRDEDEDD